VVKNAHFKGTPLSLFKGKFMHGIFYYGGGFYVDTRHSFLGHIVKGYFIVLFYSKYSTSTSFKGALV
jgi:hypothetical protein